MSELGPGLEHFPRPLFEKALKLGGFREQWMSDSRKAERRLKMDLVAAAREVNPKWERLLLESGYSVEGGRLVGPGVGMVRQKSSLTGGVTGDPVADGYRGLLLRVRERGVSCTPRQAVIWAEEHRLLNLAEIDPEDVPGPMAVGMLERAHVDRRAFDDAFNKLLARAEMEDKDKLESSGESQLQQLAPLSDGLLDPQRDEGGGDLGSV